MNNEQTLLQLGFVRHQEWDCKETGTEHYRLVCGPTIWRAKVEHNNPPVYVILGKVVDDSGHVDRWRDCVSNGSVERKLKKEVV